MRTWLAMAFIAFYAVSVLTPTVALAANEAPCLQEEYSFKQVHVHAPESGNEHGHSHDHSTPEENGDQGAAAKCCGMVFFSAIAPDLDLTLAPKVFSASTFVGVKEAIDGLPPEKLIRPPNSQS